MRLTYLKIAMLILFGMLTGGIFVPWIMSNKILHVSLNIILLISLGYIWVLIIDYIHKQFRS